MVMDIVTIEAACNKTRWQNIATLFLDHCSLNMAIVKIEMDENSLPHVEVLILVSEYRNELTIEIRQRLGQRKLCQLYTQSR
jgi:hypothetical protein